MSVLCDLECRTVLNGSELIKQVLSLRTVQNGSERFRTDALFNMNFSDMSAERFRTVLHSESQTRVTTKSHNKIIPNVIHFVLNKLSKHIN